MARRPTGSIWRRARRCARARSPTGPRSGSPPTGRRGRATRVTAACASAFASASGRCRGPFRRQRVRGLGRGHRGRARRRVASEAFPRPRVCRGTGRATWCSWGRGGGQPPATEEATTPGAPMPDGHGPPRGRRPAKALRSRRNRAAEVRLRLPGDTRKTPHAPPTSPWPSASPDSGSGVAATWGHAGADRCERPLGRNSRRHGRRRTELDGPAHGLRARGAREPAGGGARRTVRQSAGNGGTASWPRSVIKNRALNAAYAGAHLFEWRSSPQRRRAR